MSGVRLWGMLLLFCGAAGTGLSAAAAVRRTVRQLEQVQYSLEMMRCEIGCGMTPAAKLFAILGEACTGGVGRFYTSLGQAVASGRTIAAGAAENRKHLSSLPEGAWQSLQELFASFGRFDQQAQLRLIDLADGQIHSLLQQLSGQKRQRCRCYETLGICTGIALVLLVM